ncbi:hypothetical protein EJB05_25433 [Eragrostis curvula]|uniref:Histone deacetylase complex subunit SAP18 n=1 Tax=Eragrostis curvula TaxID=38414 RepID=A0A5J9VD36_9POAL|nr:hypothetical protein EJB05_25433 [Eragrostis curvula]
MAGRGDMPMRPRPGPPMQHRGPPPMARHRPEPIDREKTCPLLLRVFTRVLRFAMYSCTHLGFPLLKELRTSDGGVHDYESVSVLQKIDCGCYLQVAGHHQQDEFAVRGKEPKDEVQIYTWKDATLRELTDLVKEVALPARKRNARLSFAFVYPDKNGRFVVRPVGSTFAYGHGRGDDAKTLAELGFQIGDYLSVAIM